MLMQIEGEVPEFSLTKSVHSVSGVLLEYLKSLPEPVATQAFVGSISEELLTSIRHDGALALSAIMGVIAPENKKVLGAVVRLLYDVVNSATSPPVTRTKLGYALASTVFGEGDLSLPLAEMKRALMQQSELMVMLILHARALFPG